MVSRRRAAPYGKASTPSPRRGRKRRRVRTDSDVRGDDGGDNSEGGRDVEEEKGDVEEATEETMTRATEMWRRRRRRR
ncbi:hypothetical protein Droror1_Dr00018570 [Drosera rotundifolia]